MRKESIRMRNLGAGIMSLLCLAAVAGCTTNTSIANITTGSATLEMAVGTLNDSGGTLGINGNTLNVVTSFRNALGNSAYENPGQFSLAGPGGTIIASTSDPCDQLFSYGLFPGCVTTFQGTSVWGVPPQYSPPNVNGGYALGFIPTGAPMTSGPYTVTTVVPVNGSKKYMASATLPASPTVLGNESAPTFVSDGMGGGQFTISNPPGVIVSLVVVTDLGLNFVASIAGSGTSVTLPDSAGLAPGSYKAFVIGADYPLVESGPPMSHSPNPKLVGNSGTADLTVSGRGSITE